MHDVDPKQKREACEYNKGEYGTYYTYIVYNIIL